MEGGSTRASSHRRPFAIFRTNPSVHSLFHVEVGHRSLAGAARPRAVRFPGVLSSSVAIELPDESLTGSGRFPLGGLASRVGDPGRQRSACGSASRSTHTRVLPRWACRGGPGRFFRKSRADAPPGGLMQPSLRASSGALPEPCDSGSARQLAHRSGHSGHAGSGGRRRRCEGLLTSSGIAGTDVPPMSNPNPGTWCFARPAIRGVIAAVRRRGARGTYRFRGFALHPG